MHMHMQTHTHVRMAHTHTHTYTHTKDKGLGLEVVCPDFEQLDADRAPSMDASALSMREGHKKIVGDLLQALGMPPIKVGVRLANTVVCDHCVAVEQCSSRVAREGVGRRAPARPRCLSHG